MINKSDTEIIPVVIPVSAHLDVPTLFGTARSLGRNGVPVHVIARGSYPIARTSRYIKSLTTFPNDPPDETWQDALTDLLCSSRFKFHKAEHGSATTWSVCSGAKPIAHTGYGIKIDTTQTKPILFFCTENDLYRFAPMQNFLEQHFQLIPTFDATFKFLEKDRQLPLAEQSGFLVPKSIKLEKKTDLELVIDTLRFPIIVKPLARHTIGIFDSKGLIVQSRDEVIGLVAKYLDKPPTVLIAQEYVAGTDNDVLFFMGSSDNEGNVRAFVTGRKLRQNPPLSGMMACGYIEPLPDLESKAKALCKLYKINGFIGIECKRPPNTNDYFYIETSFRPDIFHELASGAGVNLVYDTYAAKLGQSCKTKQTADKGSWYDLFADYDSVQSQVKQKKSTWNCMLKRLPRPITYSHFAFDDPIPFFARLIEKIKSKIKRTLGK